MLRTVQLTVLASGSKGNSSVVSSGNTCLLVDAGISCRETIRRMRLARLDPEQLNAILITHEHSDHVSGLEVLARKLRIPVFMTGATRAAYRRMMRDLRDPNAGKLERVEEFQAGCGFQVGDIAVMPFTIPHDAADPVGFTFRMNGCKLGIATDLGYMPTSVRHAVRGCDVLVIESNHDLDMLRDGPYPWMVKQRVMSRVGHLSNLALAEFLSGEYDGGASFIILAHLSEKNNHPELARTAAEQALESKASLLQNRLLLAAQDRALETIRL